MDVPVRFIDSIINNPLLMQFLVHRWFFLLEYDIVFSACRKSLFSPLSKFSELHKSSENLGFQWRRTPFLGFPRTPFLTVAEDFHFFAVYLFLIHFLPC